MPSSHVDRAAESPRLKPLVGLGPEELRIAEIFPPLQGESTLVGLPTTFVRLTACDLRCNYCDAAHAFVGGTVMTVAAVVAEVGRLAIPRVCLTGGEPLLQAALPALAERLLDGGCAVSCETHGGADISILPKEVSRIVDVKVPGSGEAGTFLDANLAHLTARDEIKFVLSDRMDYEYARDFIQRHAPLPCPVLLSPVWGRLDAGELGDWLLADRLDARLQVQLHKLLWGAATRR